MVLLTDVVVRRGLDTRIGLEDTLQGPRASGRRNEPLVRAACELGAGTA